MSNNPENINFSPEHSHNPEALEQAGIEQREKLREKHEKVGEHSREADIETAHHEALEKALAANREKRPEVSKERTPSLAERRNGPISKKERDASFDATLGEIQTHMSAPSRIFSKVIHNETIEKLSDAVGTTVARPNAMLSGAIFAFAITLAVYLVAKNLGYPLSGFETIGAFVTGWILGIVYDFLKVMITGKK